MPRYVILEHRWNGVHFDFMVENMGPDNLLRTWAIDVEAFPKFVPGFILRARALPDHRRAYLDFEGEVSGGRGVVTRWDEGTCEVEHWSDHRVRLILAGRQLEGPVELGVSGGSTGGSEIAAGACGSDSASTAGGGSTVWFFRFGKLR